MTSENHTPSAESFQGPLSSMGPRALLSAFESALAKGETETSALKVEILRRITESLPRHFRKEFWAWKAMNARCYNPRIRSFKSYGAKGITVCDRWRKSFAAFLEDLGPAPSVEYSLDRIDGRGNYCPCNCRWATPEQQRRPQTRKDANRRLFLVEFNGRTMGLSDWARETGIARRTLKWRLKKLGWSAEKALTTPLKRSAKYRSGES